MRARRIGPDPQGILDGKIGKHQAPFRHQDETVSDPRVNRRARNVLAREADAAGTWRQQSSDTAHGRGLARTVAADHRRNRMLGDGEPQAFQHLNRSVTGVEITYCKQGRHDARLPK